LGNWSEGAAVEGHFRGVAEEEQVAWRYVEAVDAGVAEFFGQVVIFEIIFGLDEQVEPLVKAEDDDLVSGQRIDAFEQGFAVMAEQHDFAAAERDAAGECLAAADQEVPGVIGGSHRFPADQDEPPGQEFRRGDQQSADRRQEMNPFDPSICHAASFSLLPGSP